MLNAIDQSAKQNKLKKCTFLLTNGPQYETATFAKKCHSGRFQNTTRPITVRVTTFAYM